MWWGRKSSSKPPDPDPEKPSNTSTQPPRTLSVDIAPASPPPITSATSGPQAPLSPSNAYSSPAEFSFSQFFSRFISITSDTLAKSDIASVQGFSPFLPGVNPDFDAVLNNLTVVSNNYLQSVIYALVNWRNEALGSPSGATLFSPTLSPSALPPLQPSTSPEKTSLTVEYIFCRALLTVLTAHEPALDPTLQLYLQSTIWTKITSFKFDDLKSTDKATVLDMYAAVLGSLSNHAFPLVKDTVLKDITALQSSPQHAGKVVNPLNIRLRAIRFISLDLSSTKSIQSSTEFLGGLLALLNNTRSQYTGVRSSFVRTIAGILSKTTPLPFSVSRVPQNGAEVYNQWNAVLKDLYSFSAVDPKSKSGDDTAARSALAAAVLTHCENSFFFKKFDNTRTYLKDQVGRSSTPDGFVTHFRDLVTSYLTRSQTQPSLDNNGTLIFIQSVTSILFPEKAPSKQSSPFYTLPGSPVHDALTDILVAIAGSHLDLAISCISTYLDIPLKDSSTGGAPFLTYGSASISAIVLGAASPTSFTNSNLSQVSFTPQQKDSRRNWQRIIVALNAFHAIWTALVEKKLAGKSSGSSSLSALEAFQPSLGQALAKLIAYTGSQVRSYSILSKDHKDVPPGKEVYARILAAAFDTVPAIIPASADLIPTLVYYTLHHDALVAASASQALYRLMRLIPALRAPILHHLADTCLALPPTAPSAVKQLALGKLVALVQQWKLSVSEDDATPSTQIETEAVAPKAHSRPTHTPLRPARGGAPGVASSVTSPTGLSRAAQEFMLFSPLRLEATALVYLADIDHSVRVLALDLVQAVASTTETLSLRDATDISIPPTVDPSQAGTPRVYALLNTDGLVEAAQVDPLDMLTWHPWLESSSQPGSGAGIVDPSTSVPSPGGILRSRNKDAPKPGEPSATAVRLGLHVPGGGRVKDGALTAAMSPSSTDLPTVRDLLGKADHADQLRVTRFIGLALRLIALPENSPAVIAAAWSVVGVRLAALTSSLEPSRIPKSFNDLRVSIRLDSEDSAGLAALLQTPTAASTSIITAPQPAHPGPAAVDPAEAAVQAAKASDDGNTEPDLTHLASTASGCILEALLPFNSVLSSRRKHGRAMAAAVASIGAVGPHGGVGLASVGRGTSPSPAFTPSPPTDFSTEAKNGVAHLSYISSAVAGTPPSSGALTLTAMVHLWRNYSVMGAAASSIPSDFSRPFDRAQAKRIVSAEQLFKTILPHLTSSHDLLRAAAISAVSVTGPDIYSVLFDVLSPIEEEAWSTVLVPGTILSNAAISKHQTPSKWALQSTMTLLYRTLLERTPPGAVVGSEELRSHMDTFLSRSTRLMASMPVSQLWEHRDLAFNYALFVRAYAMELSVHDKSSPLAADVRAEVWSMLLSWSTLSGLSETAATREATLRADLESSLKALLKVDDPTGTFDASTKRVILTEQAAALQHAILAALSALCWGSEADSKKHISSVFSFVDAALSSPDIATRSIGRAGLEAHLESAPTHIPTAVNACFNSNKPIRAQGYFLGLVHTFLRHELQADLPVLLNLVLYMLGALEPASRSAASVLFEVLAKRHLARSAQIHRIPTTPVLPESSRKIQARLSSLLAKTHKELTMHIFVEIMDRLAAASHQARSTMLTYILPWIANLQLSEAPSDLVSSVMKRLMDATESFGDDLPAQLAAVWETLCSREAVANVGVVIDYLLKEGLSDSQRRGPFLYVARKAVLYAARHCSIETVEALIAVAADPTTYERDDIAVRSQVAEAAKSPTSRKDTLKAATLAGLGSPTGNDSPGHLPGAGLSLGHLALVLLAELAHECPSAWVPHLAAAAHIAVSSMDFPDPPVHEAAKTILAGLAQGLVLDAPQQHSSSRITAAEILVAAVTDENYHAVPLWGWEDVSVSNPDIDSETAVAALVKSCAAVFGGLHGLGSDAGLRTRWSLLALQWALPPAGHSASRHSANRSMQTWRALGPISGSVSVPWLLELTRSLRHCLGDPKEVKLGSALELTRTLVAATTVIAEPAAWPQLFWVGVALLHSDALVLYEGGMSIMTAMLDRIVEEQASNKGSDSPDGPAGRILSGILACRPESAGEATAFTGVLPMLLKGIVPGGSSSKQAVSLFARLAPLSKTYGSVICESPGKRRVLSTILGLLPWFVENLGQTPRTETVQRVVADVVALAKREEVPGIAKVVTKWANDTYRGELDHFMVDLGKRMTSAFFPPHDVHAFTWLFQSLEKGPESLARPVLLLLRSILVNLDMTRSKMAKSHSAMFATITSLMQEAEGVPLRGLASTVLDTAILATFKADPDRPLSVDLSRLRSGAVGGYSSLDKLFSRNPQFGCKTAGGVLARLLAGCDHSRTSEQDARDMAEAAANAVPPADPPSGPPPPPSPGNPEIRGDDAGKDISPADPASPKPPEPVGPSPRAQTTPSGDFKAVDLILNDPSEDDVVDKLQGLVGASDMSKDSSSDAGGSGITPGRSTTASLMTSATARSPLRTQPSPMRSRVVSTSRMGSGTRSLRSGLLSASTPGRSPLQPALSNSPTLGASPPPAPTHGGSRERSIAVRDAQRVWIAAISNELPKDLPPDVAVPQIAPMFEVFPACNALVRVFTSEWHARRSELYLPAATQFGGKPAEIAAREMWTGPTAEASPLLTYAPLERSPSTEADYKKLFSKVEANANNILDSDREWWSRMMPARTKYIRGLHSRRGDYINAMDATADAWASWRTFDENGAPEARTAAMNRLISAIVTEHAALLELYRANIKFQALIQNLVGVSKEEVERIRQYTRQLRESNSRVLMADLAPSMASSNLSSQNYSATMSSKAAASAATYKSSSPSSSAHPRSG